MSNQMVNLDYLDREAQLYKTSMNSLKKKDEKNVLLIIEFYWHISFVLLCPLAIILQIVLPYIFEIWTYDKIVFMPFLFAISATFEAGSNPTKSKLLSLKFSRKVPSLEPISIILLLFFK